MNQQQDSKQAGAGPRVISTVEELRSWRAGVKGRVGFVPTMGALHEGHASLLRNIRPRCDVSVLSIFVNPTQFGPKEDLAKYPRTFEKDLEVARACGADVVFAPTPQIIYPEGYSTYVEETVLSGPLCGRVRPGHFRGVTTVVLKLFNLVQPEFALFGLKDAQQFFVLHRMVRDLDVPVSVEGMQTVREESGLAMSSRNTYLSSEGRVKAAGISRALKEAAAQLKAPVAGASGVKASAALEQARAKLAGAGFEVQYLELLSLPDFQEATEVHPGKPYLLAVAAFLEGTRLIDNVIVNPSALSAQGVRIF